VYRFGHDVDTDQIVPGRYLDLVDPEDIARHVMEGADPEFSSRFIRGSMIVAGRNFGCGSSREHAPLGLLAAGVSCVVAESFGRIFYRNAINVGLPVFRCEGVSDAVREGSALTVDLAQGTATVCGEGAVLLGEKMSDYVMELLSCGGLIPYVRKRLESGEADAQV